ncbi:MAG: hypothetical protein PVJ39_15045 [Gammaproteobacteria bacterium]|jgi:hypothetical protein
MRTLIAKLESARIESMDINNAFDLSLFQLPHGHYELVVFMKLQFFFKDSHPHRWERHEQDQFIHEWQNVIHDVWGNKIIHSLPAGNTVRLTFDFHIQKGGWMFDHWEITVTKIAPEEFKVSYIDPDWNNVHLDSEDLTYVGRQRGAIHEFGHMIGLPDEYHNSRHIVDLKSIMHSGEEIRERHYGLFTDWVERTLASTGIEIS